MRSKSVVFGVFVVGIFVLSSRVRVMADVISDSLTVFGVTDTMVENPDGTDSAVVGNNNSMSIAASGPILLDRLLTMVEPDGVTMSDQVFSSVVNGVPTITMISDGGPVSFLPTSDFSTNSILFELPTAPSTTDESAYFGAPNGSIIVTSDAETTLAAPEPSGVLLMSLGLALLAGGYAWRRKYAGSDGELKPGDS
ncbi:MAG: PEP-CTERM sorting domain-containing protein [Deltaproteobacteria bacterium]|nr:PEP-CTERM sorting domain-containing protein [Deltaproteobacteria bacterium]